MASGVKKRVALAVTLSLAAVCVCAAAAFVIIINEKAAPGDADGDGVVSLADIRLIASYAARLDSPADEKELDRADVDGSGSITAADARAAYPFVSQLVTVIEPSEQTFSPLISEDITAVDASSGETLTVAGSSNAYSVISNQKMYIYPDMSEVLAVRNNFVVVTFGWGHCVGMSQYGARGLARAGYSYTQIIQHYYSGVAVMQEKYPKTVRCAGRDVETTQMLARIIQQEIAGITTKNDPYDMNALRAQAVAAYTNMKFSGYTVSGCSYVSSYDSCREDVKAVAKEIAGQYITYNSQVVYAYYSACSAGVAATYEQIWGNSGRDMSYLTNCASYSDVYTGVYVSAEVFTPQQMRDYILSYDSSITLGLNPAEWISVLEHDDAVNENIGYVTKMRLGNKTLESGAGMTFRDYVLDYAIKSPCFAIVYNGEYL